MSKEVHRAKPGTTTPRGGVVAEIYYLSDDGRSVDKNQAARVVIRELDEYGNLVSETFGMVNCRVSHPGRASSSASPHARVNGPVAEQVGLGGGS
jgi:hypothetical protein